jgi:hypothetical protein
MTRRTKPVTITHLRHDNPPYAMADDQAFAAYTAAHPNVKIENSTVKYQTLGSTLLSDLKAEPPGGIDLVRVIPSWVVQLRQQPGRRPRGHRHR